MKIISGHQPVYLPWCGLLHKASLADTFVFMDDVQYLAQDWNNRNRIKTANGPVWLTVPVKLKESMSLMLKDIRVDEDGFGGKQHWQTQHWRSFEFAYRKAPFWAEYAPWLEQFYTAKAWRWLAESNLAQLRYLFGALEIHPEVLIASEYGFNGQKSELVLDHCRKLEADVCVLGTLGRDYIDTPSFAALGVHLHFQDYRHPVYEQRFGEFASHLSVFDLLLNHGPAAREILLAGNVTRADLRAEAEANVTPVNAGRQA